MNGAGAARVGRRDDLCAVEIRRNRCRAGDLNGFISRRDGGRRRIGRVVDHDRIQSERLHGPQDTQRDLAAIGDQNAPEWPAATRINTSL